MHLLALLACNPTAPTDPPVQVDVSERLSAGQTRAGEITSEAALFGGISAEGQLGDFKIYNSKVQFVVQSARRGSYYIQEGGSVIDADIVRPEGEPGRDMVDDWAVMLGFGRILNPSKVEVISDGSDGVAHIRITGTDVPFQLLLGVLETASLFPAYGLEAVTDYRLAADSPLLEVTTTVTASTAADNLAVGDVLMGAPELANTWTSGLGLAPSDGPREVTGYLGTRNDVALGVASTLGDQLVTPAGADVLTKLADLVLAFEPSETLEAGQTRRFTRYYAVGASMAEVTDARLAGESTDTVSGTVTAPDGPVAGARVHIQVNDSPYTVAFTDASGAYSAMVPAGSTTSVFSEGRGRGLYFDTPEGTASWPAFAVPAVFEAALPTFEAGAVARPYAQGRGEGEGETLGEPATVRVSVTDGIPFSVRIGPGPDSSDRRFTPGRPSGLMAAGWSRGEALDLLVEPGTYDLVVHRGMRFELYTESITVTAGQTLDISATLDAAFDHTGYLLADTHSHASPSGDGQISMEERLMVQAGTGVQVHFGSDHDRVADYRPLVDALGLDPYLESVVADEVSSVIRGHLNAYPLTSDPSLPNFGAVHWWEEIPERTQDLVDKIRARHGEIVVQGNHPLDSGFAAAANWTPGNIGRASFWIDDLDAMEVLNDGNHTEYFALWLDLIRRGTWHTPVGVSDSHSHFGGSPGMNGTFVDFGKEVGALEDADVITGIRDGNVIPSNGVFLHTSVTPGSTLSTATTLEVEARSASWIHVDRILLYENGEVIETVQGTTASFELNPPADSVYVVVAEGDAPMVPITNDTPWATTNAILFDRGGDGWEAPLPPLHR